MYIRTIPRDLLPRSCINKYGKSSFIKESTPKSTPKVTLNRQMLKSFIYYQKKNRYLPYTFYYDFTSFQQFNNPINHLNNSTMKVFSKTSKSNKSTPTLKPLPSLTNALTSSKPKSATKIKLVKQIINSNNSNSVNKSCFLYNKSASQNNQQLNSNRDLMTVTAKNYTKKEDELNSHQVVIHSAKMISSVNCQTHKTEGDYRSSSESVDKFQSSIFYGNLLTNKSLNIAHNLPQNTSLNQNNKQLPKPVKSTLKIVTPNNQSKDICSNDKENKLPNNIVKDVQGKKMNHYKNTRLNYYKQKTMSRKVSLSSFRLGRKVGRGRFGCVYIAEEKTTGTIYALKMIDLKQVREQEMQRQLVEQIKLQMFLDHPNVLKMYGCFRDEQQLIMILEYAEEKCLFNKLSTMMEEKTVAYYTKQMINALKYCHSQNVLHRDLKPENILLTFGVAKLADFGWAAYAPKYKRSTFCGTLDYVPPEILKGDHYDQKVDIWSLGVLIYEMAIGKAPFECLSIEPSHIEQKTMNRIIEGDIIIPMSVSAKLHSLINCILTTQPWRRLSLQQIQCSAWMRAYQQQRFEVNNAIQKFWSKC